MTEKYIEEVYFQLSKEIPYGSKGQTLNAKELILKAPSSKHRRATTKLRKFFYTAMFEMSERFKETAPEKGEAAEMTSESIMQLLYSSPTIDVGESHDLLKEMLLNGCCYLDSENKLTAPLYDALLERDLEGLFGEFFLNFLFTKLEK